MLHYSPKRYQCEKKCAFFAHFLCKTLEIQVKMWYNKIKGKIEKRKRGNVMAHQSEYFRHHVIVPIEDTVVEDWIKKQNNFSGSLRVLIKQYVLKYGVTDILCSADLGAGMFGQQTPNIPSNDSSSDSSNNSSDDSPYDFSRDTSSDYAQAIFDMMNSPSGFPSSNTLSDEEKKRMWDSVLA